MINPNAIYDTLFIGHKLQEQSDDFSISELQLFCYMSCLMSLYEKTPISFWGYKFVKNELGVPLSIEIIDSVDCLLKSDEVQKADNYYTVTKKGMQKCLSYSEFPSFKSRDRYLNASCDSALTTTIGNIRRSICNEPIVKSANNGNLRFLNDEDNNVMDLLYDQFSLLKKALPGHYEDLFVPAITWLKFLILSETIEND